MAQKKKPQTEAKAKGLVGWKGGKQDPKAKYKVGDYRGKTLNLTGKQLGAAGRSAAAKRSVDISKTRYEGKKVLGPAGKPLTGTVDLGGGNIAVYKNGVRVSARKTSSRPSGPTRKITPPKITPPETKRRTTDDLTAEERNKLRGDQRGPKTPSRSVNTTTLAGIAYASLTPEQKKWYESTVKATGRAPSLPYWRPSNNLTAEERNALRGNGRGNYGPSGMLGTTNAPIGKVVQVAGKWYKKTAKGWVSTKAPASPKNPMANRIR